MRIVLGYCEACGSPLYSFESYIIPKVHCSCDCINAQLLVAGIPHLINLATPFEDSIYGEEEP